MSSLPNENDILSSPPDAAPPAGIGAIEAPVVPEHIPTPPPEKRKKWTSLSWKKVLLAIVGLVLAGLVWIWLSLPNVTSLLTTNPRQTAFMRYRMQQKPGKRIRDLAWTPLSRISSSLIQAVLIAEDDKFFQHEGFDWESMRQAMESNLKRRRFMRGGSTITQQLAKNLYLNPSRSPMRKIREMAIAISLEKHLTKKRILELYLNAIEWGDGIFGITAAARHYFGATPGQLSFSQAIRLASVLPNPVRFRVLQDDNRRMQRKRLIIAQRMLARHVFTEEEYQLVLTDLGLVR